MAKAGRPKADVTKEKVVSVRMKPEDYEKLKKYADSSEMTVTEVVQKLSWIKKNADGFSP